MKILAVLHLELFADILTSLFAGVVATLSISKALSEWGSSAILTWFLIARYDTSVEKYIELAINVGSTKFCQRSVNLESNFCHYQFFHKTNTRKNYPESCFKSFVCFFGRIDDSKNCFPDLRTFIQSQQLYWPIFYWKKKICGCPYENLIFVNWQDYSRIFEQFLFEKQGLYSLAWNFFSVCLKAKHCRS